MQLKIKIALHNDEFTLEPIIETECRFKIENNEALDDIQELIRFVVTRKLQISNVPEVKDEAK